ncbi:MULTISPECIES: glycoside hydrolase family 35 protein [Streptomyces]|uniref:Beta-galactosidase n=1 Tax=Streptomyces nymphaeiformis TaxID=2663842 RepID=A0A7W7TX08_9ACTN|nr:MULTISPECIES: beta-galactosidase family protein [Streptomyces]MBB4980934.1 beta-galactosidase [Streptomyces nymphaeiformis]SEE09795.1 beta-galactosidase [Streptomyces sp. TLI_105]
MNTRPPLTVDGHRFLRGGHEHRVVSAAVHYFRIHPGLWRDRLQRLQAMGCNTVELYIAWNFHQPTPGPARFGGWHDVAGFIREADALGLDVIARPGPYICAEWDLGGLPAWLLADESMRLRTSDPAYLAAVDQWFDQLIPVLAELQTSRGGPIVAVQVENEYGSYGNDAAYLEHLKAGLLARGIDCLLFTSDGPEARMLAGGTLPGVLATANFGSRPDEAFAALTTFRPDTPLVCMEFWNGWFDHFGDPHHVRDAADAAEALDGILSAGGSVNIYMGHGGTNFGWWAGANHTGKTLSEPGYMPTITSYDYDAPIGEAGELTEKFHAFREVIGRHVKLPDRELPAQLPRVAPQTVPATPVAALRDSLDQLSTPSHRPVPEPMEKLGHHRGLVHYRHRVTGPGGPATLTVDGVRDLAQVFLDGRLAGVLERDDPNPTVVLDVPEGGAELEILVEPFGRVNYGPHLADRKGLIAGVRLDHQHLFGWDVRVLPLDDLAALSTPPAAVTADGPVFHRATVDLPQPADAFLAVPDSHRTLVWLNGFLLGRLRTEQGPQRTLYAPAPLWHAGTNEILVLDLAGPARPLTVELRDQPDLGPVAPAPRY